MGTLFVEANADANVHLVNASINSLPCMLCPASSEKRFVKRRDLLEHLTNEHLATHLFGCHLCDQALDSYPEFIMHDCFVDREEFELNEPKFTYCHALLICADCGIQFILNGSLSTEQAMQEYLALMAVHNSTSMKLVCIYSAGPLKKDQSSFWANYNLKMKKMNFLCKNDEELNNCCPSLCPNYYNSKSMGIASFARTTKQFECLELINVKPRIKAVSIDDVLSPVIQTETKIRSMMSTIKRSNIQNGSSRWSLVDENDEILVLNDSMPKLRIHLNVIGDESCISEDILRGFMFDKDIYECAGCRHLFDSMETIQVHYRRCSAENKLLPPKFDVLSPRCARLIFNNSQHPSSRVACGKCPNMSFCSFTGLRLHYARDHLLFIDDDHGKISNKKSINSYGSEIVAKTGRASSIKYSNLAALKTDENLDISKNRYANRSLNKLDLNESPEPKRVAFTLFGHKRRVGSTSLEEMAALTGNVAERSTTPASSSSEMTIRRRNTAALDVDTDARRVTSSRSTRSRISHSPMAVDDHNSSSSSLDNQRKRPPSERAKQMEMKKLEKERREIEDAEKEDKEREVRRRRRNRLPGQGDEALNEATINTSQLLDASQDKPFICEPQSMEVVESTHSRPVVVDDDVVVKKRARKEPETVDADVEIIDLSDDSDGSEEKADSVEPPASNASSHQSSNSDSCTLFCFFCGQDIVDTVEFVHHMSRHTERFQRCPVCIVSSSKEHQFKHVLHVIDHIVEKHIRQNNDHCVCPFCHKDFGYLLHRQPLYLCFQHILFSCESSKYCMVCLATNDANPHKLRENFLNHGNEKHFAIYNRFICSKCMTGFPTKFALLDHTCVYTYRCVCNVGRPFTNKQTFLEHVKSATDDNEHQAIKPNNGALGIYMPNSYRKQLKTYEIESSKHRKINHPERNDYFLFFQKYPHLFMAFEPLSTLAKNLQVIKTLSIDQSKLSIETSNKQSNNEKETQLKTRKRFAINGESIDVPSVNNADKPIKKVKRKHANTDGQAKTEKKFTFVTAHCQRSDVWKLVDKYGDDYREVADVLEDLILSVSDNATMFANGMLNNSTKRVHQRRLNRPNHPKPTVSSSVPKNNNMPRQSNLQILRTEPKFVTTTSADNNLLLMPQSVNFSAPFSLINSLQNNNSTPSPADSKDESDDEEIEIIGEVKRQQPPKLIPATVQYPTRTFILYPQRSRVVNVSQNQNVVPQRSFSSLMNNRPQNMQTNNGELQNRPSMR